jgi:hypothetical protein
MSLAILAGVAGCIMVGLVLDDKNRNRRDHKQPPEPPKPLPTRWWLIPIEDLPRYLRERRKPPNA